MFLNSLSLQNFRSHGKADFQFSHKTTFIVGPNGSGKTNLLDSIYYLSHGKSYRSKDEEIIKFQEFIVRIKGKTEDTELEVVIQKDKDTERIIKKFLVNGVSKKRADFAGNLSVVSFSPLDLDIVIGAPGERRNFLDSVLEGVDRNYRFAKTAYDKGLRQRNSLLSRVKDNLSVPPREFEYWDRLLIENGNLITQKREEFIGFINGQKKEVFDFNITYDKSVVSEERFLKYFDAERGTGVTLVGPHRDDFLVEIFHRQANSMKDARFFASRGQQRLIALQLKFIELVFIEARQQEIPMLLLDDIFSELDEENIELVTSLVGKGQSIITATHEEFIDKKLKEGAMIELKK